MTARRRERRKRWKDGINWEEKRRSRISRYISLKICDEKFRKITLLILAMRMNINYGNLGNKDAFAFSDCTSKNYFWQIKQNVSSESVGLYELYAQFSLFQTKRFNAKSVLRQNLLQFANLYHENFNSHFQQKNFTISKFKMRISFLHIFFYFFVRLLRSSFSAHFAKEKQRNGWE